MGNTTSILAIEVGSYCKDFRVTPNCRIAFNGDEVESFGNLSVGEFPGAPDVAGEGVLIAFVIPTIMLITVSCIMIFFNMGELFLPKATHALMWQVNRVTMLVPRFSQAKNPKRNSPKKGKNGKIEMKSKNRSTSHTALPIYELELLHNGGDSDFRGSGLMKALVLATVDVQLILLVAYGWNFSEFGICTMSAYHYNVFINVVLIACSSFILAALVLPSYWKNPIAAGLRVIATMVVFFFAFTLMIRQHNAFDRIPERLPPPSRNNSLLLLPATCFLDPILSVTNTITSAQGNAIISERNSLTVEFWFFVVLSALFVLGIFGQGVFLCLRRRSETSRRSGKHGFANKSLALIWIVIWVAVVIIFSCSFNYVLRVRQWVDKSGWREIDPLTGKNPESEVVGLGQLLPVWALVLIIFAFFTQLYVIE